MIRSKLKEVMTEKDVTILKLVDMTRAFQPDSEQRQVG
jgi:hypothetical protein